MFFCTLGLTGNKQHMMSLSSANHMWWKGSALSFSWWSSVQNYRFHWKTFLLDYPQNVFMWQYVRPCLLVFGFTRCGTSSIAPWGVIGEMHWIFFAVCCGRWTWQAPIPLHVVGCMQGKLVSSVSPTMAGLLLSEKRIGYNCVRKMFSIHSYIKSWCSFIRRTFEEQSGYQCKLWRFP